MYSVKMIYTKTEKDNPLAWVGFTTEEWLKFAKREDAIRYARDVRTEEFALNRARDSLSHSRHGFSNITEVYDGNDELIYSKYAFAVYEDDLPTLKEYFEEFIGDDGFWHTYDLMPEIDE